MNDNFDDNYGKSNDRSQFAEKKDDFEQFNSSIDSSIKEYKEYNNKIRNFFVKHGMGKSENMPSTIDDRILDKKYDEW